MGHIGASPLREQCLREYVLICSSINKYMQNFKRVDWLRARQLIPNRVQ